MQTENMCKGNYVEEIFREILSELKNISFILDKLYNIHCEDINIKKQAQEKSMDSLNKLISMFPPGFAQMINIPNLTKKGEANNGN